MKIFLVLLFTVTLAFASHIQPRKAQWVNSVAPDVAYHRLFIVPDTETIIPFGGNVSPHVDVAMPTNFYDLPGVFSIADGSYKVGLCAVDESGNISDVIEVVYTFDFTVPANPSALEIVDL